MLGGRLQSVTQFGGSKISWQRCAATAKADLAAANWWVRGKPLRSAMAPRRPSWPFVFHQHARSSSPKRATTRRSFKRSSKSIASLSESLSEWFAPIGLPIDHPPLFELLRIVQILQRLSEFHTALHPFFVRAP